jgi:D-arabinose 1-dehydrogenase-like Zn-dependent alcohol dehydrogenase
MVASTELLNKITKMIVDGNILGFVSCSSVIHLCTGKVKPVIDSVHRFDDVYSAYDKLMTGHARGKVVIEVV